MVLVWYLFIIMPYNSPYEFRTFRTLSKIWIFGCVLNFFIVKTVLILFNCIITNENLRQVS